MKIKTVSSSTLQMSKDTIEPILARRDICNLGFQTLMALDIETIHQTLPIPMKVHDIFI